MALVSMLRLNHGECGLRVCVHCCHSKRRAVGRLSEDAVPNIHALSPSLSREALQLKVAMQVMLTARRWKLWMGEMFRNAGHTGAPIVVLYHLADEPKGLTLLELSVRMELSGASLTRLVQRLERDGFVSRHRMIGDGRSWLIIMEPAGRAEMQAFEVHAAAMRQRVFQGIPEDDLATVVRVMNAVADKLAEGPEGATRT